jgi:hypothetical protein
MALVLPEGRPSETTFAMRTLLISLAAGIAIAVVVYAVSSGRVLFLPLILVLPLTFFTFGRRR